MELTLLGSVVFAKVLILVVLYAVLGFVLYALLYQSEWIHLRSTLLSVEERKEVRFNFWRWRWHVVTASSVGGLSVFILALRGWPLYLSLGAAALAPLLQHTYTSHEKWKQLYGERGDE